jgi:hypothetical protein
MLWGSRTAGVILYRLLLSFFIGVIFATASASGADAAVINAPGPSAELFKHPYYTCVTNYYVSATGSDSNSGTGTSTPWLTSVRWRGSGFLHQCFAGNLSWRRLAHDRRQARSFGWIRRLSLHIA